MNLRASFERTKTDATDAEGLARLAFENGPAPTPLRDEPAELVRTCRHRYRLRQDLDDRVRQLYRLADAPFPSSTRYVRSRDSMLATALIVESDGAGLRSPTPGAWPSYDGRHFVSAELADQLAAAAQRSVGQHQGPVYALQARHLCQDLDLWRRRLAEINRNIESLIDGHQVGKLLLSIEGLGSIRPPASSPRSATRPASGARAPFAAYVIVVPGLRSPASKQGVSARRSHPWAPPGCGAHCGCRSAPAVNAGRAGRERLTLIRVFEEPRGLGYEGGYDAVRRYAAGWQRERSAATAAAFVPLSFAPGEAYQFDWSHEVVLIAGATVTVKVAQVRLCHSRMLFVRAYPRESQEMVFDAHDRAFAFFRGACTRGIYDNMKTAVDTVLVGKARDYHGRFQQMCGHYLVEPVACTPASGWEKGQVENQVWHGAAALLLAAGAGPEL